MSGVLRSYSSKNTFFSILILNVVCNRNHGSILKEETSGRLPNTWSAYPNIGVKKPSRQKSGAVPESGQPQVRTNATILISGDHTMPSLQKLISFSSLIVAVLCSTGISSSFHEEIDAYFRSLDDNFAEIVGAGTLKGTNMRAGERFLLREMKKNITYHTFFRANSKGMVISELVRGQKIEQPMRDVSGQRWFKRVEQRKEPYYTLLKDGDRGRYYLFWCRPILKDDNRFVGAVATKIDLWDSFYSFSNSTYTPFLVKLGRKTLFSHKWQNNGGIERQLSVPGIDKILVVYSQEKPHDAVSQAATPEQPVEAAVATESTAPQKKKSGTPGLMIFFLVVLLLGIAGASGILIAWMRNRAKMRAFEEDDEL
jgi:hypothetical protein